MTLVRIYAALAVGMWLMACTGPAPDERPVLIPAPQKTIWGDGTYRLPERLQLGIADTVLIAAAGYAPMLYGNQRDLLRLAPELRAAYPVWLAEYDVEAPTAPLDFAIWQYTNAGTVPGIPTDVDLNVWLEPQK